MTSTFIPGGGGTCSPASSRWTVTRGPRRETEPGVRHDAAAPAAPDTNIPGPGQVHNNFNANPTVSRELNLLRGGGSRVETGNLLTLPLGGGLLYVQPVYVKGASDTAYPLLQKVLVAFGDKSASTTTLDGALNSVFGGRWRRG